MLGRFLFGGEIFPAAVVVSVVVSFRHSCCAAFVNKRYIVTVLAYQHFNVGRNDASLCQPGFGSLRLLLLLVYNSKAKVRDLHTSSDLFGLCDSPVGRGDRSSFKPRQALMKSLGGYDSDIPHMSML